VAKKSAKKRTGKAARGPKAGNLTKPSERLSELVGEIQRIDRDIAELDLKDNELEAKDLASAKRAINELRKTKAALLKAIREELALIQPQNKGCEADLSGLNARDQERLLKILQSAREAADGTDERR
jgi:hypothetical protein